MPANGYETFINNVKEKECPTCGKMYKPKSPRSLACSRQCTNELKQAERKAMREAYYKRFENPVKGECLVCGASFKPTNYKHKYCSPACKGKVKYILDKTTTSSQYASISGNWDRYLPRLLYFGGRKRDKLTFDILKKKLVEQNYKCAISGLEMTCLLDKGKKFWTNVSVDRIEAGGSYTEDNIQLVCRAVNSWRSDTPLDEFIDICKAIAKHNGGIDE